MTMRPINTTILPETLPDSIFKIFQPVSNSAENLKSPCIPYAYGGKPKPPRVSYRQRTASVKRAVVTPSSSQIPDRRAKSIFGRPYYRSSLWYSISSVCRLSVTFLADRTIGRAFGTLFRLSVCRRLSSVCDVLYCGKTVRPSQKVSEGVNRKPGSKSSFFLVAAIFLLPVLPLRPPRWPFFASCIVAKRCVLAKKCLKE